MKLKYYLRGLGIGIVVTAVIMMVALGNKQPMTDEEVIARAKELGMIENAVLSEVVDKEKEPVTEPNEDVEQGDEQDLQQEEETVNDNKEETPDVPKTDIEEDKETDEEDASKVEESDKSTISVTVVSGDSSWSVSKRMEENGLIESAKDFDNYLCGHGYDKRISVGTYEIPTTATQEEMAKIITRMN